MMPRLHLDELNSKDKETIEELFPGKSGKLYPTNVEPDILIEIDHFNNVMQFEEPITWLPSGLYIGWTFFGPVLSGLARGRGETPEYDLLQQGNHNICNTFTILQPRLFRIVETTKCWNWG
ncbi:hypothetical protein Aduo_009798 [Ancylostoma duodenale]